MTAALLFATVKDVPDLSVLAVGDKQCAIWSFCHAVGARQCVVWICQRVFAGKPVGENLKLARGLAGGEWLEGYVRRSLWQGGPVPGTMKGHERSAFVARGKLAAGIKHHVHGGPMCRIAGDRKRESAATSHDFAIAAIFRIKQELLLGVVKKAIWPAEIKSLGCAVHRLGRA